MGAYCARIPLHVGRQVREDRLSSRRPPTRAAILQDDQFDGGAQLARPLECFPISGLAHGAAAPSGSGCGVFRGVPNIVTYCSGRLLPHCVLCIRFLTEQPRSSRTTWRDVAGAAAREDGACGSSKYGATRSKRSVAAAVVVAVTS